MSRGDEASHNFESLLELQNQMQVENFHEAPRDMTQDEKMRFLVWNAYALTDEIHEALAETGWKPWSTSNHLNQAAFQAELVDAFHFFMNLMLVSGMTMADLAEGYITKRQKNIDRQNNAYDGVSTKCPHCHRALDDDAVECTGSITGCVDYDLGL